MRKLGLSFSYGGAYVGYYYGVYEYLHETFDLTRVGCFAGVSAGCQVAFWMACGIPPAIAWNQWFVPTFRSGCTHVATFGSPRYYPMLRETALHHLRRLYEPSMLDACNRSLYIGVTVLGTMQKATHHTFASQDDLYHSILASQCIPFLFDTHVTIRGTGYVDGALSHGPNYEPCDGRWIHINVFTWEQLNVLGSLASLRHLQSMSYHAWLKARGYEAAKRRHDWFVKKGMSPKVHGRVFG